MVERARIRRLERLAIAWEDYGGACSVSHLLHLAKFEPENLHFQDRAEVQQSKHLRAILKRFR